MMATNTIEATGAMSIRGPYNRYKAVGQRQQRNRLHNMLLLP
jgi:hypothetical protein